MEDQHGVQMEGCFLTTCNISVLYTPVCIIPCSDPTLNVSPRAAMRSASCVLIQMSGLRCERCERHSVDEGQEVMIRIVQTHRHIDLYYVGAAHSRSSRCVHALDVARGESVGKIAPCSAQSMDAKAEKTQRGCSRRGRALEAFALSTFPGQSAPLPGPKATVCFCFRIATRWA